jgi:phage shock protein A
MEDMFSVIQTLESTVSDLETELEKAKIASENRKARVAELEELLLKYEKQIEEINGRDSFK